MEPKGYDVVKEEIRTSVWYKPEADRIIVIAGDLEYFANQIGWVFIGAFD